MRMHARPSWRKGIAGLGLFALLLQLVLSFAHVHVRDLIVLHGRSVVTAQASTASHQPAGGLPDTDDDCPVCAAMRLTASGIVPLAPIAAGPAEFVAFVPQLPVAAINPPRAPHTLFQTRAPPLA